MEKHRILLMSAVAIIAVIVTILVMVWREPMPEQQGTAPSVVTGRTGTDAPLPGAGDDPREVQSSEGAARAERGTGVEGVHSGGTTIEPPSGR